MHHLKNLGAVCVLVVAAMAIAGVGTAAAEQGTFCKSNETPCSAFNHYPKGTEVVLDLTGELKFVVWANEGSGLEWTCQSDELKGSTSTTGGSTQAVEVAFTSHTLPCGSPLCFVTVSQNPKMRFNWISGTMNASAIAEALEYTLDCTNLYGFKCTWGSAVSKGIVLEGGNPAVLAFEEASLPTTAGFGLCGSEVRISGKYEVVAPKPLYVSS